ncbi:phosphate ABC transporter permease PstA [Kribbella sp. NPDC051718]|uniref:phosphate ABC transporter permease PstA n=1 Tax=Kribbella sp. NPDC051718 TaxID=3155168 RepID=UPI00342FAD4B
MSTIAANRPQYDGKVLDLTGKSGARAFRNTLATVLISLCFLIALIPLCWILWTVVSKGYHLVLDANWWSQSQRGITSRRAGGGAYHALVGSLIMALICAAIAVPLGILGAVYLIEYGKGSKPAKVVSFMVDILTGVPSIVAALFVYAVWVTILGQNRIGFAVSLSLVLLMMPVILRSTEEMLKLVPDELREASYALGVPKWKTILNIVVPTAFGGIITGVMLGLARVIGETAPLLILVGYSKVINYNPFSGFMGALPTMINNDRGDMALPAAADRVWAAALTLILLVLALNLLARLIARFSTIKSK